MTDPSNVEEEIVEVKKKIESLWQEMSEDRERLRDLREQFNRCHMYNPTNHKKCLEVIDKSISLLH